MHQLKLLTTLFAIILTLPCTAAAQASATGKDREVVFEDNVFYGNNLAGVRVRGSASTRLGTGRIYGNGRAGVNVGGLSNVKDKYLDIIVDDITVYGNGTSGVNVEEAVKIDVARNWIHDNSLAGIRMLTTDKSKERVLGAQIHENRIYRNGKSGVRSMPEPRGSQFGDELDLVVAPAVNLRVHDNEIHDNTQAGLRVENDTLLVADENRVRDNGMGIISFESLIPPRLDIYRNKVSFNTGPGIHVVNGVSNEIGVRNNWVYNNERSGIVCGIWSSPDDSLLNVEIINNTVVSNGSSGRGAGIRNNSKGNTVIMNNIVAYNYVTGIRTIRCKNDSLNLLFANGDVANCCDDPEDAPYWVERNQFAGCPERGKADLIANPLFVNPDKYDFHLEDDSPAIDSGNPLPIYDDISLPANKGTKRNDMGATGGPYAAQ